MNNSLGLDSIVVVQSAHRFVYFLLCYHFSLSLPDKRSRSVRSCRIDKWRKRESGKKQEK